MKKKITLFMILALMAGFDLCAQNYVILVRPSGMKEWGYADLQGNMLINARYRKCTGFSGEGLAAIYDGDIKRFYFINLKGETLPTEIQDFKLKEVLGFGMKGFQDGMAAVKVGEKWGFLNAEGKLAVQAKYDKVTPFGGGYASVQLGGRFFVIDKNGAESPVDIAGLADVNDFSEGLASYKAGDGKIGFIDGSGKIAIEAQFESAGDFHGSLAWAKNSTGSLGFINPRGDWIFQPKYEAAKDFDPVSGMARIKTDKWAYISKSGEVVYMNDSDLFEDFSDGLCRGRKDGKLGFFNPEMKWAVQPQFDGARDFKNGYASVKLGDKWGVIDKSGNWVIKPVFDEIKDVEIVK